ncbi:hypothetical protein V6Z11_D11G000500 [Gossypium hirsutum]
MHILIIPKSKDGLTGLSKVCLVTIFSLKVSLLRTSAIHINPSKRRFIFEAICHSYRPKVCVSCPGV